MEERFRIVFSGELQDRAEAEDVITRLVSTFKLSETKARALVRGDDRQVLKKDLDEKAAQRYRAALDEIGMIVHVERMASPADVAPSVFGVEERESVPPPSSGLDPTRCPACGSTQIENGVCCDCGAAREDNLGGQTAPSDGAAAQSEPESEGGNPYATPRADLRPRRQVGEMRGPQGVPAGHGWGWIVGGFWHFKTKPLAWILALIVLVGVSIAMGLIPILGGLATSVLSAVFTGGLMFGASEQNQGRDFRVEHLFAGFREHLGTLALVGLLYLVGGILIAVLVGGLLLGAMAPMMAEPTQVPLEAPETVALFQVMGPIGMIALLVGMLLFIPVVMAFLFAPALVMLDGLGATEAMKQSFVGCLKNILPFLVYGFAALLLLVLAVIPLGLGLLVVWPTLTAAIFVAYRDIYFD